MLIWPPPLIYFSWIGGSWRSPRSRRVGNSQIVGVADRTRRTDSGQPGLGPGPLRLDAVVLDNLVCHQLVIAQGLSDRVGTVPLAVDG